MKIKFLAGCNNYSYKIVNETVNGIDLSVLQSGDVFIGNEKTKKTGIIYAERNNDNVLYVTLEQCVIASQLTRKKAHWREGGFIDAKSYDAEKCYVIPTGVADLIEGKDYQIVKGIDCTGTEGWTIKEVAK